MKNSSVITKLLIILPTLTVLVYFGAQTWRYFTEPAVVTTVYEYCAEQLLTLNGFVVRDEEVVACSEPLVELTRAEGERVAKGRRIATVYQSAEALTTEQNAAALSAQLAQLRSAKTAANDTEAALRLDSEIEDGIVTLRAALADGDYAATEDASSALKTLVLRREYAYRGGGSDLDGRIAALEGEIAALRASASGSASAVTAPFAGTYSAVADGYERVLTPAALETMTVADFAHVAPEPVSSTVGRMIRGESWYYVAAVQEEAVQKLAEGQELLLAVSGVDVPLPVTVARLGAPDGGRRLLVLRGTAYLSSVSMLRAQSAELILERIDGLRVPKNAVRIDEAGQTGVYCRLGRQVWFKPVRLLYQGEDYCLVLPDEINAKRESDYILYTLRAGDEVIVSPRAMENGKVLEQ
ncbi:MAG: hypothetical protein K6G54_08650 [Oscillospiraceae bacterium]|nr:hypothetical protein [Oscillospiraceae bacterium]